MPKRRGPSDLEVQLQQMRELADAPDTPALRQALQAALLRAPSPVAARAAGIAQRRRLEGLEGALRQAWERFLVDGVRSDPSCAAKLAALDALDHLDVEDDALWLAAARLVQMEAAWGPPVDTAPPVRARAALALSRVWGPEVPLVLAELLADPAPVVRRAAVEAIRHRSGGTSSDLVGLLVMRFRLGDDDPVARLECLSALVALAPGYAIPAVEPLLVAGAIDAEERELVAQALAESRQPAALQALARALEHTPLSRERAPILAAIAAHRSEEARGFLLRFIAEDASLEEARIAVEALARQLFTEPEREALLQAAGAHSREALAMARLALQAGREEPG